MKYNKIIAVIVGAIIVCNLSQAIYVACKLTVHTVRKIAAILSPNILPLKRLFSMEETIVVLLCIVIIALCS